MQSHCHLSSFRKNLRIKITKREICSSKACLEVCYRCLCQCQRSSPPWTRQSSRTSRLSTRRNARMDRQVRTVSGNSVQFVGATSTETTSLPRSYATKNISSTQSALSSGFAKVRTAVLFAANKLQICDIHDPFLIDLNP